MNLRKKGWLEFCSLLEIFSIRNIEEKILIDICMINLRKLITIFYGRIAEELVL